VRLSLTVVSCIASGMTAALLITPGCSRKPVVIVEPPEVEVMPVLQKDVPVQLEWIGTLDGLVHAHVHPQVAGYLMARCYREGARVKNGELMFEIDPRSFQATLDQAQAKLGKDEIDVKRLTPLAATKAVSQQDLDDAVQAYLGDKAAVEQAQVNLGFTKVTSPIDGWAGLATAEVGDLVGPNGVELTTVTSIDPIKAYFSVSEVEYLSHMERYSADLSQRGTNEEGRLELILADGSIYPHPGRFYAADNQLSPRTGTLRIAALFPNPACLLRPGQFIRVRMTRIRREALIIPQRAVSELQGNYQVSVIDSTNMVHVRAIKVGETTGAMWIVATGLSPGERVVVEGVQKVRDGILVHPRPYAPTSTANPAPAER